LQAIPPHRQASRRLFWVRQNTGGNTVKITDVHLAQVEGTKGPGVGVELDEDKIDTKRELNY